MHLPLLERAKEQSAAFTFTPRNLLISIGAPHCSTSVEHSAPRIPQRALEIGEQYRFHFDMTKCIGCKCCVVACNEQNGNPAHINWRRVGEIEGGWYPNTQRLHLSMGCNHCLEPTCLTGCPVDAYSKDPITGVVILNAETCIGCQYCTWNCSYGVPQYNAERGVVGKCDMCHNRLTEGREPACVGACPEGAIQIEIVNIADWKRSYAATANAPGLPTADDSLSSTRITLPKNLPPDTRKVDMNRVRPEHPHWPLVFMTVLTQLSVGAFAAIWLLQVFGLQARLRIAALVSLTLGGLALGASTIHLGRPMFAYRALKMWKRSWLSREVLLFGVFSQVAFLYAALLWFGLPISRLIGAMTILAGAAGVAASACIYLVRPRPAWHSKHTFGEFYLSGAILGPLLAATIGLGAKQWLLTAAVIAAGLQLLNLAIKFFWLVSSDIFELKASARLLSAQLRSLLLLRSALLIFGGIILPLQSHGVVGLAAALALAFFGEILGRYLFFVSVVPKNMAASYLGGRKAAA
ncbi:MAG TPA: DmsC/YnfH family molybdoenzyme membrane anchor subunit [Candidatus Sulfotelmatobacter sp.]|jgi:formate dehydrogenase iron-sulfur subunit|nr:DmsC/YnfH family molybdoenzyme membrane anchor subunit [Candidatus Sulfotelmatobacter sp.]